MNQLHIALKSNDHEYICNTIQKLLNQERQDESFFVVPETWIDDDTVSEKELTTINQLFAGLVKNECRDIFILLSQFKRAQNLLNTSQYTNCSQPIHFAARYGSIEITKILIHSCNSNLHEKDHDNKNPIYYALHYTVKQVPLE